MIICMPIVSVLFDPRKLLWLWSTEKKYNTVKYIYFQVLICSSGVPWLPTGLKDKMENNKNDFGGTWTWLAWGIQIQPQITNNMNIYKINTNQKIEPEISSTIRRFNTTQSILITNTEIHQYIAKTPKQTSCLL